jgi:hypothetical protein
LPAVGYREMQVVGVLKPTVLTNKPYDITVLEVFVRSQQIGHWQVDRLKGVQEDGYKLYFAIDRLCCDDF